MKYALCLLTMNEIDGCKHDVPLIPFDIFDQVFAIDNNSKDGTIEYLKSYGIEVVQQKRSTYNGAYLDAFEHCSMDILIIFHPKGTINPQSLREFPRYFDDGYELVVASRLLKDSANEEDSKLFKPRKWFVIFIGSIGRVLWKKEGNSIYDVLHGYRAMTKTAFQSISPLLSGATIDAEMVFRAYKKKIKRVEFPVIEKERISGNTHFPAFKTGKEILKYIWFEFFRTE